MVEIVEFDIVQYLIRHPQTIFYGLLLVPIGIAGTKTLIQDIYNSKRPQKELVRGNQLEKKSEIQSKTQNKNPILS